MRVNIYAEEMTEKLEIISKEIDGHHFTGLRFWLYLPTTLPDGTQAQGPFIHRPGDDDSSAVTFWGKRDLRTVLRKALEMLDKHYEPLPANATGQMSLEQRLEDIEEREREAWAMASMFLRNRDAHGLHDAGVEIQALQRAQVELKALRGSSD